MKFSKRPKFKQIFYKTSIYENINSDEDSKGTPHFI